MYTSFGSLNPDLFLVTEDAYLVTPRLHLATAKEQVEHAMWGGAVGLRLTR